MKRFYWIDKKTGDVKERPSKVKGKLQRMTRVYVVKLKTGPSVRCWPDLVGKTWWYPVDGGLPIKRGQIAKYWEEDGTDIAGEAQL